MGVTLEQLETLQLVRYHPSQKYEPHHDYFKSGTEAANNRTYTGLVYLNDLEPGDQGGATRFPNLKLEIKPQVGRIAVWANCRAEGNAVICDERTLHGGDPPEKSTKYALNIWARGLSAR